jgi:hypothetical protein
VQGYGRLIKDIDHSTGGKSGALLAGVPAALRQRGDDLAMAAADTYVREGAAGNYIRFFSSSNWSTKQQVLQHTGHVRPPEVPCAHG